MQTIAKLNMWDFLTFFLPLFLSLSFFLSLSSLSLLLFLSRMQQEKVTGEKLIILLISVYPPGSQAKLPKHLRNYNKVVTPAIDHCIFFCSWCWKISIIISFSLTLFLNAICTYVYCLVSLMKFHPCCMLSECNLR